METIQVLGTERNDIWSRDLRMGKKKGIRKDHDRLHKMDIQFEFLHTKIYSEKRIRYRKVKNKIGNKGQKIRRNNKRNGRRKMDKDLLGGEEKG